MTDFGLGDEACHEWELMMFRCLQWHGLLPLGNPEDEKQDDDGLDGLGRTT